VSQGAEPVLFREKFADWPDLAHDVAQKWQERGVPKDQRKQIESATDYIEKVSSLPDHFDVADMVASQLRPVAPFCNGCGGCACGTWPAWTRAQCRQSCTASSGARAAS
jgi:hypothetical protein